MTRFSLVLLLAAVLAVTLVLCTVILSPAQQGQETTTVIQPKLPPVQSNPVVSALPYVQQTEFEPDPFEPDRIRSSRLLTKSIVLVRADGSTEIKRLD